jgi:hypothetical protein
MYLFYDFFSPFGVSSSVLDEHPAVPQVGSPAFRIMNCRASQMPTTSKITQILSTATLLSREM